MTETLPTPSPTVTRGYGIGHLDVDRTLDSGQNLRARHMPDGRWQVASGGRVATVWQDGPSVSVSAPEGDIPYWERFLSFDDDYDRIRDVLSSLGSDVMDEALSSFDGVRVIHQEPFEAFVTSIITQNNNIPRIRKCVETLCSFPLGDDEPTATDALLPFPNAERLLAILSAGGRSLGLGYRLPYLQSLCEAWLDGRFSEMVGASEGRRPFDADELESCEHDMARLLSCRGIGPKVASCCCLFGLGHASALPRDVWIRRFEERYDMPWVPEIAGIQQQYVFEWMRLSK